MNWQQHIAALQASGLTQQQIADACNCAQTTISDLATGASKQPVYSTGAALLELAKTLTGNSVLEVSAR